MTAAKGYRICRTPRHSEAAARGGKTPPVLHRDWYIRGVKLLPIGLLGVVSLALACSVNVSASAGAGAAPAEDEAARPAGDGEGDAGDAADAGAEDAGAAEAGDASAGAETKLAEAGSDDGQPPRKKACNSNADCGETEVCEGEGCGENQGICMPKDRMCTRDLVTYCGCDGATFQGSGSCPGQRFASRGACEPPPT